MKENSEKTTAVTPKLPGLSETLVLPEQMEQVLQPPESYCIYITKNSDVARILAEGLKPLVMWSRHGGKTLSVSHGCVNENPKIPVMYHGNENFYAMGIYRNGETGYPQKYEIIVC